MTNLDSFLRDVLFGLRQSPKSIPGKYMYDARGSDIFARICQTDDYYVTRAELTLLEEHLPDIAATVGKNAHVLEFGSGEGIKTERLLAALPEPASYTPVDISTHALEESVAHLQARFPRLAIHPIDGDYTDPALFDALDHAGQYTVYFPGSTLGNFTPDEAVAFMRRMRHLSRHGGGVLLGIDVMKDPTELHRAYNDREGLMAEFDNNLLLRLNRELGADFDLDAFAHEGKVNLAEHRVELHLVSQRAQEVRLAGEVIPFTKGETIHTIDSYKYTPQEFIQLAAKAGLKSVSCWLDGKGLFSMHYLVAAESL